MAAAVPPPLQAAWLVDAACESTPLATTGGHTWPAARRLFQYLSAAAEELGLLREGVRVLELGAGNGWLGVSLARNLPRAALMLLTEQQDGLPWLQYNVQLNRGRGLPLGSVRVQACDWRQYTAGMLDQASPGGRGDSACGTGFEGMIGSPGPCTNGAHAAVQQQQQQLGEGAIGGSHTGEGDHVSVQLPVGIGSSSAGCQLQLPAPAGVDLPAGSGNSCTGSQPPPPSCPDTNLTSIAWDFILGSDLIYNEIGSRCLPRILAALCRPAGATCALYCHTKHRFDLLDLEFFEQLEACGLQWEEVWEPGVPPPPDSPPLAFPPTDLFPAQRIAVYRITKLPRQ